MKKPDDQIDKIKEIMGTEVKGSQVGAHYKMTFGKYKHQTLENIAKKDLKYLAWLKTITDDKKLVNSIQVQLNLATYKITLKQSKKTKLTFGKHKGQTLSKLAITETGYLRWVLTKRICPILSKKIELVLDNHC